MSWKKPPYTSTTYIDGEMREGAERATLSACGEWTAMDEARDYGGGVTTYNDVRMELATDMTSTDTVCVRRATETRKRRREA